MSGSCTKASRVATRLSLFSRRTVMTCRRIHCREEMRKKGLGEQLVGNKAAAAYDRY